MQIKYNRSLSGLPEQGGARTQYTSANTQRILHKNTYEYDERDKNIRRLANHDKIKRRLNDSDKENQNLAIKVQTQCKEVKTNYDHTILENANLLQHYCKDILEYIQSRETVMTPKESLGIHVIPLNLRAKMVDWMIEVLSSYKCTEQTFFQAVRIMDSYFQQTKKPHEISDLHLTGVTSMFMAAKYEEIHPMKLSVVHDKIAHKKLSINDIKNKESDIFEAIGFNMVGGTIHDFYNIILVQMQLEIQQKNLKYLHKLCLYLAKMILYEYDLLNNYSYNLLSAGLVYVGFKIIEQLEPKFNADNQIKQVENINHDELVEVAQKILNLAKTFDKKYPNFENLKKFNGFSLEEQS